MEEIYRQTIAKVAKAAQGKVAGVEEAGVFRFSDHPVLGRAVDGFIKEMGQSLQLNIERGNEEAWTLSAAKNDSLVSDCLFSWEYRYT